MSREHERIVDQPEQQEARLSGQEGPGADTRCHTVGCSVSTPALSWTLNSSGRCRCRSLLQIGATDFCMGLLPLSRTGRNAYARLLIDYTKWISIERLCTRGQCPQFSA